MRRFAILLLALLAASPAYAQRIILKGATDQSVDLRIIDSTDGSPETGVVYNTAGIDLWYRRPGAAKTSITEATLASLTTAHADGGFLHIGDGVYRLDLPDAAVASGVDHVVIGGTVTGMIVKEVVVQLSAFDLQTATPAVDLSTAERQKITKYSSIVYIATTDNAKTIIEAQTSGTLCILAAGSHSTTTINVPAGVHIRGSGWQHTTLTGNPGGGSGGNLVFEGSNLLEGVKIVTTTQGHCVQLKNSATPSDVVVRQCWLCGDDDCIGIYEATGGGRQRLLVEDSVMDCTVWDGMIISSAHADVTFRGTRWIGSFNGIYVSADAHRVSIDVQNCKFDFSATSGTQRPILVTVSGSSAARIFITLANTSFNCLSGSQKHIEAGSGSGTGLVWIDDNGGCNINDAFVTLTGSGARFQRTYPVATNVIVAASTLATNAATAATQSTTAATQSTAAASSASTAVTQTTASAQRAALGFASANADTQLSAIASSASTASTQSTNAASQTTASAQRAALGFASANADTQLSGIASNAGTAATQATSAASQTTASAQRAALGFSSANADTQLSGIASNASTAATQSTNAASSSSTAASQSTTAATQASAANTKLGTPAVSVSADLASVKTDTGTNLPAAIPSAAQNAAAVAATSPPQDFFDNAPTGGGGGGATAEELVEALLAASVPYENDPNTIADCLNAARAQAVGKWSLNASTKELTIYAADGTTPIQVFTVGPNLSSPLNRTPKED